MFRYCGSSVAHGACKYGTVTMPQCGASMTMHTLCVYRHSGFGKPKNDEDVAVAHETTETKYETVVERIDEWPRVHTCLHDWCPKKSDECRRCDAIVKIARRPLAQSTEMIVPEIMNEK